jgi:hypothetical protein
MSPIVITGCTNRKRFKPDAGLTAESLPSGAVAIVAQAWAERIRGTSAMTAASSLYCGRAFAEAASAAKASGGELFVVSAGLGLLAAHTAVPSYSLTITRRQPDSILDRLEPAVSAADWWRSITALSCYHQPFTDVITEELILVALPRPYLTMILDDLQNLPQPFLNRLRLFTLYSQQDLPPSLQPYLMPYDRRLDGEQSVIPGTMADFAQRALRHFVEWILPESPGADSSEHRDRVEAALNPLALRKPPTRTRATDEQIETYILAHWSRVNGSSSRMLRVLRDDLAVACEQGRFHEIFQQVASSREESSSRG